MLKEYFQISRAYVLPKTLLECTCHLNSAGLKNASSLAFVASLGLARGLQLQEPEKSSGVLYCMRIIQRHTGEQIQTSLRVIIVERW